MLVAAFDLGLEAAQHWKRGAVLLAAGGKLGGFSARGGQDTKLKLLAIEGAAVAAQGNLFL